MKISSVQTFYFFSKNVTTFPTSRKCKNGKRKFQVHRYFGFAIATLPLFECPENVKISISPFTMSRQKCCIFKSISRIFKNFLFPETWGRWLLWLKISSAQTFSFCNSNVTTFQSSRKCKNYNFSLHTVPAEMLYLFFLL